MGPLRHGKCVDASLAVLRTFVTAMEKLGQLLRQRKALQAMNLQTESSPECIYNLSGFIIEYRLATGKICMNDQGQRKCCIEYRLAKGEICMNDQGQPKCCCVCYLMHAASHPYLWMNEKK